MEEDGRQLREKVGSSINNERTNKRSAPDSAYRSSSPSVSYRDEYIEYLQLCNRHGIIGSVRSDLCPRSISACTTEKMVNIAKKSMHKLKLKDGEELEQIVSFFEGELPVKYYVWARAVVLQHHLRDTLHRTREFNLEKRLATTFDELYNLERRGFPLNDSDYERVQAYINSQRRPKRSPILPVSSQSIPTPSPVLPVSPITSDVQQDDKVARERILNSSIVNESQVRQMRFDKRSSWGKSKGKTPRTLPSDSDSGSDRSKALKNAMRDPTESLGETDEPNVESSPRTHCRLLWLKCGYTSTPLGGPPEREAVVEEWVKAGECLEVVA